jgi:ABC-2 type transport system permease protein
VNLAFAHVRARTLELARLPAFTIPTVVFPAVLYLAVAGRRHGDATAVTGGFAAIAVLGVSFFQFGVGIASERVSPWERYLRSLPAGPVPRIGGRVGAAIVFASCAAGAVLLAGLARASASLPAPRIGALAAALVLGAIPFALLGTALGYVVPARAAVPVANFVYLPLAYAGGLWSGPDGSESGYRILVPTRAWAQMVWAAAGAGPLPLLAPLVLCVWTAAFGLLAAWAYRRDEGERFR